MRSSFILQVCPFHWPQQPFSFDSGTASVLYLWVKIYSAQRHVCVCVYSHKKVRNLALLHARLKKTFWQITKNQRKVKINSMFLSSTSTQLAVFCFAVVVSLSLLGFWCRLGTRQLSSPEQFEKMWDENVQKTSGGSTYSSRSSGTCLQSQSSATLHAAWCRIWDIKHVWYLCFVGGSDLIGSCERFTPTPKDREEHKDKQDSVQPSIWSGRKRDTIQIIMA